MEGEIIQPLIPAPAGWHRRPIVLVIVVAIVLVVAIIWLGDWVLKRQSISEPTTLTEAQKQEILRSLALPSGTPPLTAAQKSEILKSLQLPPNTPPLTDAQKAEILNSLK